MEFLRFSSAQRYGTRHPLSRLSFRVTVARALLVEENKKEEQLNVTVRWDQKVHSPQERVTQYNEASEQRAHDEAVVATAQGAAAPSASAPVPVAVQRAGVMAALNSSVSSFFTRPTMEDFIDVAEEDFPVDPPQGPSRLAPVILRQHRKDHQPNHNMFFMWAFGSATADETGPLRWRGTERVMCTITAEKEECFFTARPGLQAWHTLLVDSLYIYTFRIDPIFSPESTSDPLAPPTVRTTIDHLAAEVDTRAAKVNPTRLEAARAQLREALQVVPDVPSRPHSRPTSPAPAAARHQAVVRVGKGPAAPSTPGCLRYFVFGVVERCLGVPQDSLFLKCQIITEGVAGGRGGAADGVCAPSRTVEGPGFTTQLAFSGRVIEKDFLVEVDHVFNTPFEYSYEDRAIAAAPMRLVVSAYTEGAGADGLQSPVGYASITVPTAVPGRHTLEGRLWVPRTTAKEFLKTSLVGGGPSLVDPRQAGPALEHRTGISVKEGLVTTSSGRVFITVNVLHQR